MGTWLDSGINVLSYLNEIVNLDGLELINKLGKIDINSNQTYYLLRQFKLREININIVIDWSKISNKKESIITLNDNITLIINHTKQIIKSNDNTIFIDEVDNRLDDHYNNLFFNYTMNSNIENRVKSLHEIFF